MRVDDPFEYCLPALGIPELVLELCELGDCLQVLALLETLKTARKELPCFFYFSSAKVVLPEERPNFRALAKFLACPFVLFFGFFCVFQSGRI